MLDRCPKCGKTHLFKPKKCECGYDASQPEQEMKCPNDQTPLTMEMVECPKCKGKIDEMFEIKCPKCWKWTPAKNKHCPNCATELWHEEAACPYCNKMIDARSIVCPKCGKNLYLEEGQYQCATCGTALPTISSECPVCSAGARYEPGGNEYSGDE